MSVEDRAAPAARTPLLCDRYRLGALLGRGGAGRVYEALDVMLGRHVAVKMFQSGGTAVGRYRFAAEARILAGLSHPALVTIYDVCLDGDEPFLVMQLVDGTTLRDVLDRGPLEPAEVARLGARLADVLAYVHARDIVHRDIKPSNVLVDEAGNCHLTDFGIARALNSAHLTVSGEFVGTAAYLAPEQITDIDVGPAADIYSLGLLLLECLTGHTEYTGSTVECALARLNRPPRIPDTLPSSWHTLLTAMTARDQAARPDAGRCADMLTAIAEKPTTTLDALPLIPEPRHSTDHDPIHTKRTAAARLPRPRAVHAGLTALAIAAAACAIAAATTTTPGQPTSELRDYTPPTTNTTTVPTTTTTGQSTVPALPVEARTPAAPAAPAAHKGNSGKGKDNRGSGKPKGKNKGKG